jgi:hypothetical protein
MCGINTKIIKLLNKNIIECDELPNCLVPRNINYDERPLYSKYGIMCRRCGIMIKNKLVFDDHYRKCVS